MRAVDRTWLAEARSAALARFRALGLPTTKHEAWRFTNVASLAPIVEASKPPAEAPAAAELLAQAPRDAGPRLVFANGRFREDLSDASGLPAGAILASLQRALADAEDLVRPHLGRLARPDDHAFVALNAAHLADGAFLFLPRGARVEAPIQLVYLSDAPGAGTSTHPRTLVVAEEAAHASVAELFVGRGGGGGLRPPTGRGEAEPSGGGGLRPPTGRGEAEPSGEAYLVNAVTEIVLGEGARVEHFRMQDEAERAAHVSVVHAEEAAGARLVTHALALGAALSRSETRARLAGEGSEIDLSGLFMAGGAQHQDVFSWVEHAAPRCTTAERYKGILDGRARGAFAGRIRVLPGAQKTSAYQSSSNLLLSADAVVDTRPELEIFADDVKCGHGGTVGQLDEEALFYLRSRGIAAEEARSMLVYAFAREMVELVGPAGLRERARRIVATRLPGGGRVLESEAA